MVLIYKITSAPAPPPPALASPIVTAKADASQSLVPVPPASPSPIANSIGMKLALIPAGAFPMGSTDSDPDALSDEKPQHRVRITQPFYLGVTEVTQGQYQAVMSENPSQFKGSDDLPVEQVSWLDAVRFCNKLSDREGRNPYYRIDGNTVALAGGDGYRLPTEAEWEYACRAGTTTRFSFGDDEKELGRFAWYDANSNRRTHPVGERQPNAFGLYDMHGNVWEWCWDGYDSAYYKQSPANDPQGPGLAAYRVYRGGGWSLWPRYARSAHRNGNNPVYRYDYLGLRLARVQSSR
jgi:formylglycine-generating enzyme required for sulfatase activity